MTTHGPKVSPSVEDGVAEHHAAHGLTEAYRQTIHHARREENGARKVYAE